MDKIILSSVPGQLQVKQVKLPCSAEPQIFLSALTAADRKPQDKHIGKMRQDQAQAECNLN